MVEEVLEKQVYDASQSVFRSRHSLILKDKAIVHTIHKFQDRKEIKQLLLTQRIETIRDILRSLLQQKGFE